MCGVGRLWWNVWCREVVVEFVMESGQIHVGRISFYITKKEDTTFLYNK